MVQHVDAAGEPFALRLARALAATRGLRPGVVPEAAALARAGHYVLCGLDGATFTIACIVDREHDPGAQFPVPPETVQAIGAACAHHAPAINGMRMPVAIHIVEVGAQPP